MLDVILEATPSATNLGLLVFGRRPDRIEALSAILWAIQAQIGPVPPVRGDSLMEVQTLSRWGARFVALGVASVLLDMPSPQTKIADPL